MQKTLSQVFAVACLLSALTAMSCKARQPEANREPRTTEDKVFYALGVEFGRRITSLSISPAELSMVQAGLRDAVSHRTSKVDLERIRADSARLTEARKKATADEHKVKGLAFIEKISQEPGTQRLDAGVVVQKLQPGTGVRPGATDIVRVNYEGRLLDGTVFDNSYRAPKQPLEVGLLAVMSCWQIGIPAINVGAKARLFCPSEVAYGDDGMPPVVAGGATLIFDVELLGTRPLEAAPEVSAPRPNPPQ